MTITIATFVGNGSQTDFAFSFDYLRKEFVKVLVDGVDTAYTFHTTQTVRVSPAPTAGKVIIVKRVTDRDRLVQFVDGSILVANDLNVSALQAIHISAEALDAAGSSLVTDASGAYSAGFRRIADVGDPTLDRDVVNKQWAETASTSVLSQTIAEKNLAITARNEAEGFADDAAQSALDAVLQAGAVPNTRLITAGSGLLGGGDLTANRTLSADYATNTEARAGVDSVKLMSPALVRAMSGNISPSGSGTVEMTFSGIPEEATHIDITIAIGLALATQHLYVRPNNVSTGYVSNSVAITGTTAPTLLADSDTTGLLFYGMTASTLLGVMSLQRLGGSYGWMSTHVGRRMTDSAVHGAGQINLAAPLTSLRMRAGGVIISGGSCTLNWRI